VIGVPTSRALARMATLEQQVGAAATEISLLMGYAGGAKTTILSDR